jgi:hypothetical protein
MGKARWAIVVVGYGLFLSAGLVLYLATIYYCYRWWGVGWAFSAAFIPPVCELFPFVMWAKVGLVGSLWYLVIWGVGIAGMVVAALVSER